MNNRPTPDRGVKRSAPLARHRCVTTVGNGDVVIAAITSCTNTSNPAVMIAAGIVAKKAAETGLTVPPYVKTSLAPGSRVVTEYLEKTGLQTYLDKIGFDLVGYGCTTCIGNSGPLDPRYRGGDRRERPDRRFRAFREPELRSARASEYQGQLPDEPPLVVAYALAGTRASGHQS